jgi:predicted O-methyltransferase YrrM
MTYCYRPWHEVALKPGGRLIRTSVTAEEAGVLAGLARNRHCLEIGSAYGFTAIVMAMNGARSVVAVDPHKPHETNEFAATLPAMEQNLEAYGVRDKVLIVLGTSAGLLPEMADQGRRFGLVLIDGDHEQAQVAADAAMALQLLGPGGVLAGHDYGNCATPGVANALDALELDAVVTGTLWVAVMP